ncbi:ABC transporter ATP-binding protein [Pararhodobacter oceanensis]|uniref:ABC transporter ATP-binding protein n=1 Tax=Pararhodobacter oceanensis TaxID=2172121 RepID=UPI003A901232
MLDVTDLTIRYGKHTALDRASIHVEQGKMVAILGANGAGKSSLLGAIGGRIKPASGAIRYRETSLLNLPDHRLVEEGISLVPEGRGIFPGLTVLDNLQLGALPPRAAPIARGKMDEVLALFPKLGQRLGQIAGTMSGGEQQMVAIGRALMSNPDLLLLDEPSLGLAPIVVKEVFSALSRIRATGLTILIVEQNARATLELADYAYLMEVGRITGAGPADQIKADPAVIRAFLGGSLDKTQ